MTQLFRAFPLLLLAVNCAFAQVGDMWTQYAIHTGLFTPHTDTCGSTEVFVAVGGGSLGFCIEKDERTAAYWDAAKETCAAAGKRLPEIAEFKYACSNPPTGLNDMTGNYEWASNTPSVYHPGSNWGVTVASIGGSACHDMASHFVGRYSPSVSQDSIAFRCVR